MIYLGIFLFVWFAYWSAESGASLPWSKKWQDFASWGSQLPEWIIAISVAMVAIWGWDKLLDISAIWVILSWVVFFFIVLAGKESATWAYLNWTGHTKDKDGDGIITDADGRDSTMRDINNWIAGLFSYKLGDEGYSWVWAFTKGLITTAPLFGIGAIFQPLWREAASHAKGRLPGDSNTYMEIGDGFAYASAAIAFILIVVGIKG